MITAISENRAETLVPVSARANAERIQDRSSNLQSALEIELIRARRYHRPLSLITIEREKTCEKKAIGIGEAELHLERRLPAIAPMILRVPDFWGRFQRQGFVIVLPETDVIGGEGALRRIVKTQPFEEFLSDIQGLCVIELGVAEFRPEIRSALEFVLAARANPVWTSASSMEEAAAPPASHAIPGLGL